MPIQTFEPMTKDFATFDCDAHVTEPPLIWERAGEFLTRDEMEALRATIWWDNDTQQLIVGGKAGVGIGSPRRGGIPGTMRVISNAGPGVKHDIQRALNVRNLDAKTALTQAQVSYLDFAGSYEPEPRLRDMDVQGIDQVMIIPTDIDTYPWLPNAVGARAFCRAYNEWAYGYTKANPDRLFFAALLPMQNPAYAAEEVYRVAKLGCRVALIRPNDAMGNYPLQPKYEPVWKALEETGLMNDTIILRLADHGEGGLAHGMREKAYTVYEEMIHIPLIVHNPKLYPEPMETAAFYDHLNLLPTILDLAGVADAESYGIGKSIVPIIRDPSKTVQDHTIFSFDDLFFVPASAAGGHIRAVREGDWTYAVYFGLDGAGLEYELYNLKSDPGQMTNLVHGNPTRDTKREWGRLHKMLTERLVASANLPDSFGWPLQPALA